MKKKNLPKTEEDKKTAESLIRHMEIGLMCITALYQKFLEERPVFGTITEKDIRIAYKAFFFSYTTWCENVGFEPKSLHEINLMYGIPIGADTMQ